jgi:hypothetical protein
MAGRTLSFIDGKEVEWADVTILVDGIDATLKSLGISYGVKVDKEHLFAGGDEPVGIQSGNRTPSGVLTVLKENYDILDEAAIAAGGRDITDLVLQLAVFYKPKGNRPPRTEILEGAEFSEFNSKIAQGDKKMPVELPFLFLRRRKKRG